MAPTGEKSFFPTSGWTRYAFFGTWALISFLIFARLIFRDPLLAYDDHLLIDPLTKIASLHDYVRAIATGKILDLQPLRDLSFLLNIWAGRLLGYGGFHLVNWVLWVGIVLTARDVMRSLGLSAASADACALVFSFHPLSVGSVAWCAARKHLLSTFFILRATRLHLKSDAKPGQKRWLPVLFALSLLSHPLYLLWPVWAWAQKRISAASKRPRRADFRAGVPLMICAVIAVAVGAANIVYYDTIYRSLGHPKHPWLDLAQYRFSLLALGRYFFNVLFPARLAAAYHPAAPWNPLGLLLIPAAIAFLRLRAKLAWSRIVIGFVFFLFPLIPVTFPITPLFVADTYVLGASLGVLFLLFAALPRAIPPAAVLGACAILAFASFSYARAWRSDGALWEWAYETEASIPSATRRAETALEAQDFNHATQAAFKLLELDPGNSEVGKLLALGIYQTPQISFDAKADLIKRTLADRPNDGWLTYYLARSYAEGGHLAAAKQAYDTIVCGSRGLPAAASKQIWQEYEDLCGQLRMPTACLPPRSL